MSRRFAASSLALAFLLLSATPLWSQEALRWETDLAAAQRIAAQTNRLVLVHFWGTWCGPCVRMEQDVFSKPGLGTAIMPYYVPVKIQCEDGFDNPLAKQFGVQAFPCDIMMTAQGQIVNRSKGMQSAEAYVAMLQQTAQTALAQARTVAAVPPASPPVIATAPAAMTAPPPAAPSPVSPAAPPVAATPTVTGGDRYASYRDRLPGASGVPAATQPASQPATAPSAPPIVAAASPGIAAPAVPAAPVAPSIPAVAVPAVAAAKPAVAGDRYATGDRYSNAAPSAPMIAPPAISASPAVAGPATPSVAPPPAAPSIPVAPAAAPPVAKSSAPVQSGIQLPPGCPPLALDGFCPVTVTEKMSWKKGDVKFGAIHRDRTYLFLSLEDQQKFLSDPDRFSPVMSGNDPVLALEKGEIVNGSRKYGLMFEDRMFLFSSKESYEKFCKDSKRYGAETFQAMQAGGDVIKRR